MIISLANRIEIPKLNILKKMYDQIIKCDKKYLSRKFGHSEELLSGEPDYFGRNKISSGGDLSHYSSASLY